MTSTTLGRKTSTIVPIGGGLTCALLLVLLVVVLRNIPYTDGFRAAFDGPFHIRYHHANLFGDVCSYYYRREMRFEAKSSKNKKKRKRGGGGGAPVAGIKGFGGSKAASGKSSSSSSSSVAAAALAPQMDRSKDAMMFYDFLERHGAGDNLKRTALGYFPLPGGGSLRGVVALKSMKKGDVIIEIPYELAVNLGLEGSDPTIPAKQFLEMYCRVMKGEKQHSSSSSSSATSSSPSSSGDDRLAYFRMLPSFRGEDCLGSTDFFTDDALEALHSPLIVDETLKRRERTKRHFTNDIASSNMEFPSWIDDTDLTEEHLRWAVWIITSRVLTVQGDAAAEAQYDAQRRSYRLLIPFLDMCNHDRTSQHVLTGRAVPGGALKVVAGRPVEAGEQINICYGGGLAGNDRFIQDYGFLDSNVVAFNIVAQQLLGKKRMTEGTHGGRMLPPTDRDDSLASLRSTTIPQDEAMLAKETDPSLLSSISYRLGVKKALSKYIIVE